MQILVRNKFKLINSSSENNQSSLENEAYCYIQAIVFIESKFFPRIKGFQSLYLFAIRIVTREHNFYQTFIKNISLNTFTKKCLYRLCMVIRIRFSTNNLKQLPCLSVKMWFSTWQFSCILNQKKILEMKYGEQEEIY